MYERGLINKLTESYMKTEDDSFFEKLIEKLTPMIDIQLGKQYSSMKEDWDDMRQDVLLRLWENRRGIKKSSTRNPCRYFYGKIQEILNRTINNYKKEILDNAGNKIEFVSLGDLKEEEEPVATKEGEFYFTDVENEKKDNVSKSIRKVFLSDISAKAKKAIGARRSKKGMTHPKYSLAYNEWGEIVRPFGERRGIYHKNLKSA